MNEIVISVGEESEVAVDSDEPAEIPGQRVEAGFQTDLESALAVGQGDGLGVFPHVDQVRAKISFEVELVVVETDERFSQEDRHGRAADGVTDGHHEEKGADAPQNAGE